MDQVLTERKVLPEIQSELEDPEGCYLCGTAPESLMGYFRQFDDLGVICVNQWYVLDMGILGAGISFPAPRRLPVGFPRWKSVTGKTASWTWRRQKLFFARSAWIGCFLPWKPMARRGKNQSPGICAWWIFRRWNCIPCRSSMPATTSGIIMCGWIRQRTGWRLRRFMRRSGIDGILRGKSGRLPLCYPVPMWYDESILKEGSGIGCRSRNVRWI